MIPMKKESKTICFNDFAQAVSYLDDTEVGLFVTSLERNGDGESLGVLIVIVQLAPASFHAMLDDGHAEPPGYFFACSTRKNGSVMCSISSAGTPGPLSRISTHTRSPCGLAAMAMGPSSPA